MGEEIFFAKFNGKSNAVRKWAPVRLVEFDAVPRLIRLSNHMIQTHPLPAHVQRRARAVVH